MIRTKINSLFRLFKMVLLKFNNRIEFDFTSKIDYATRLICFHKSKIRIGYQVVLRSNSRGYHAGMPFGCTLIVDVPNAEIIIGDFSRLNGVYVHSQKKITIGKNCVIASGVNILDSNGHILNSCNRTIGRDTPKEIEIGNNVWIGINVVILKGTVIGNNSVVSANSVVKGIFPNNSLIEGNPASVKKILTIMDSK